MIEMRDWLAAFAADKTQALFHVPNMVYAYLRHHEFLDMNNELTPPAWSIVSA
jgi:hypothetical protein